MKIDTDYETGMALIKIGRPYFSFLFKGSTKLLMKGHLSDHLALINSAATKHDKRGRWMLVTTARDSRWEDHQFG